MYAPFPLPSVTTEYKIFASFSEVSREITLRFTTGSFSFTTRPDASVALFNRYGVTISPPFIAADAATASSMGVSATACPNPMRARSTFLTVFSARVSPDVSPVTSMPVFEVIPKFFRYS